MKCFRCDSDLIEAKHSTPELRFWGCPVCQLNYEQRPGEGIHDMGFSPIPVILASVYGVDDPESKVDFTIDNLVYHDQDGLQEIVDHIERELMEPKQKVSEIHLKLSASEDRLRAYLGAVSKAIQESNGIEPTA